MRMCRCGAVVEDRCERCDPKPWSAQRKRGTTKERGYGDDWRRLSERYRAHHPLCQVCEFHDKVTPAWHVHHIIKIGDDETRRLDWDNLLSVCKDCHDTVEHDQELARKAKYAGERSQRR